MNTRLNLFDDGSTLVELKLDQYFFSKFAKLRKVTKNFKLKEFSMKRDISEFVSRCLICQQVKAEHQVPSGLLQLVMIPEWKWDELR
ncbi:integrase [Gossypium australe]|uniref:Integrase n=1 Tax=Gossypium australe TaxID=47621 RepID=A0A5B6X290_9ROSI|nr:integrase [Gossypium australe]